MKKDRITHPNLKTNEFRHCAFEHSDTNLQNEMAAPISRSSDPWVRANHFFSEEGMATRKSVREYWSRSF